jgi:xanthine dehydrogenase accessory factor
MTPFWRRLADIVSEAGEAAVISLLEVKGSAPRDAGARMIVRPDAGFTGTIGGGALEWQALAGAQQLLRSGDGHRMATSALGPALGQCCGGSVTLLYERFDRSRLPEIERLARREAEGPFMTRGEAGPHGIARSVTEDPQAPLLERFGRKRWPLYLFGAGHTGRAVVLALAPHPFAVVWVESRADAFPGAMPGNATPVRTEAPPDILARAPDESLILVMTHSHALDQEIVQSALAQDRFRYVGLIGSASKRARFVARMASAGLPRARR